MLRRSVCVPLAAAALVAAAVAAPSAQAAPTHGSTARGIETVAGPPAGLRLIQTSHSLLGTHTWYQQTSHGVPVVGGWYAVHTRASGPAKVDDGRIAASALDAATIAKGSLIGAGAARQAVVSGHQRPEALRSASTHGLWLLPARDGAPARYVYAVRTITSRGSWMNYVDAEKATVLQTTKTSVDLGGADKGTGRARVFDPNPVVRLQNEKLKDKNDAASAVPLKAYHKVTLQHLSGRSLVGKWVRIINKKRPVSRTHRFLYFRKAEEFEMVSAYYAVDTAQTYLRSLGFTDVNAESQDVRTNAITVDNSFYIPGQDRIEFGSGGVDDAEDIEVVWHEYGHAVQDAQVPGFGSSEEAGAIGEGFGDYLAVTLSQVKSPDTGKTPSACVADWDSISYTSGTPHCLRRTDGTKVYPTDLDGEVHDDGEIWSRALWDINQALGRSVADRIIIEAQFSFTPGTDMPTAAQTTVDTALALYDATTAAAVQQAFADRGILAPPV